MSEWIHVKEGLPKHGELVLVYAPKNIHHMIGMCTAIFLTAEEMMKEIIRTKYAGAIPKPKHNYYFASIELDGNFLSNVVFWRYLPPIPRVN